MDIVLPGTKLGTAAEPLPEVNATKIYKVVGGVQTEIGSGSISLHALDATGAEVDNSPIASTQTLSLKAGDNVSLSMDMVGGITIAATSGSAPTSLDASVITSGVLDIARIPQAALERLVTVADQAARFALTTTTVQLGDTVKELDTGYLFAVVDEANLGNANGYVQYTAGGVSSVAWGAVTDKPDDVVNITTRLSTKVDTVAGKGLSTNDYTTDEKNKLAVLTNAPEATASVKGLVQLAGDLSGSASSPTLSTTGVTAGTYNRVTVDAKGRISAASNPIWNEKFILFNTANGYVSPLLPLTRNGTSSVIRFYPQGAPSAATSVYAFRGNSITLSASLTNSATSATTSSILTGTTPFYALIDSEVVQVTAISGTTITIVRAQNGTTAAAHNSGAIVMLPLGNVSLSTSSPVNLTLSSLQGSYRDLFAYNVSGTGLTSMPVTIVQEWSDS